MSELTLAVVIVTRGRAAILGGLLRRLARQTRRPDFIVVSASEPSDIEGAEGASFVFGPPGVGPSRNRALEAIAGEADLAVFLDDDFTPSPAMLARVEALFLGRPQLVGALGHVVKGGVAGPTIGAAEADKLAAALDAAPPKRFERPAIGLYGSNMVVRLSAAEGLTFDETTPVNGWQEDLDFGVRLAQRGDVIRTTAFGGVHRGVRTGAHPQRGLGYAQVATPVRLMRRGTIPKRYLMKLMVRNLASNAVGAVAGGEGVDRRGRFAGNLIAFRDLALGELDPDKASDL